MYYQYTSAETEYLKSKDARLSCVIDQIGHVDREVDPDVFYAIAHHIAGQQISGRVMEAIWQRLEEKFGEITPETIHDAGLEEIKACGLSMRKAEYIKNLADKVINKEFDPDAVRDMSDEEAIESLTSLRGVGVWTAEMILIFCLQRPDVLSFGDYGIQKGMRMVYRHRKIDRKLFEKYKRRLSPCGSVASLYFWEVAGGAVEGLTDPASKKRQRSKL